VIWAGDLTPGVWSQKLLNKMAQSLQLEQFETREMTRAINLDHIYIRGFIALKKPKF